jgi:hypothetical protein
MQSMRDAKGSLEKREEKAETKDGESTFHQRSSDPANTLSASAPSTTTSGSAFGFGGLDFGAPPAATSPATSQPLGTSIFGSATPTTVKTPPAGGFGAFGSALKPGAGFSFGSVAPKAEEEQKKEVEAKEEKTKEDVKEEAKEEKSVQDDKVRFPLSLSSVTTHSLTPSCLTEIHHSTAVFSRFRRQACYSCPHSSSHKVYYPQQHDQVALRFRFFAASDAVGRAWKPAEQGRAGSGGGGQ